MLVQEPVQAAIWHCLNHYAYGDATFLAERLYSEVETDESLFLVATCYYRSGKVDQAYHVLQSAGAHSSHTRFLLAKCAADLQKDSEAETVLRGYSLDVRRETPEHELISNLGDKACFGFQILSGVYQRSESAGRAAEADRKALKLNPFLWSSFVSLCNLEESAEAEKLFQLDHLDTFMHCHGNSPMMNLVNQCVPKQEKAQQQQPQQPAPQDKVIVSTPHQALPAQCANIAETPSNAYTPGTNLMETPVMYYNTVSTPVGHLGAPHSGLYSLNTSDLDCIPRGNLNALLPPPIKPKEKKSRNAGQGSSLFSSLVASIPPMPSFGVLAQTPSPGLSAHVLPEFFSPQLMMLSPVPQKDSSIPFSKSVNTSTPGSGRLLATPGAPTLNMDETTRPIKRVAMAAKADNQKPAVLGQTAGNVITPSPGALPPRRSSRLFGSTQSVKENSKAPNKNRNATKSPSRKSKTRLLRNDKQLTENEKNEKNKAVSENKPEKEKVGAILDPEMKPEKPIMKMSPPSVNLGSEALKVLKQSAEGLMTLLRQMGAAYKEVARFNCKKAVELFENLPPQHQNSGWTLALLGKCYFEMAEYKDAKRYFEQVREKDPYRLALMEYYSTTLWHLQDEVELSALAQDLTRIDKFSAASWCAAGNCFSHQKEHENAIKFFQRAVQVEPRFAYAYTLLGHEYVLVEELDKALNCFRTAARLDHRHYNAWYGIGLTYYKQERFQLAEIYYRKALSINPASPILMCHVAVVQHALQKTDKALETLNVAIAAAPLNPLCKFERASILHSNERYQEALEELKELKDIVPKESPVYFLIGKVENKLGNTHRALMHFSWAMDLDPKGANSFKDALDPSLNRAAHEGNPIEDHSDVVDEPMIQESGLLGQHEDFQGEVGESFEPVADSVSVSSPLVDDSPRLAEEEVNLSGPSGMILNDSDDSL